MLYHIGNYISTFNTCVFASELNNMIAVSFFADLIERSLDTCFIDIYFGDYRLSNVGTLGLLALLGDR